MNDLREPTTVTGPLRRSYSAGMFAAITEVRVMRQQIGGGWATVTFDDAALDEPLPPETVAAIRELMASRDDADLARRHAIREACEGGATNLAQILAADRLDEALPEPIYPEPTSPEES